MNNSLSELDLFKESDDSVYKTNPNDLLTDHLFELDLFTESADTVHRTKRFQKQTADNIHIHIQYIITIRENNNIFSKYLILIIKMFSKLVWMTFETDLFIESVDSFH